jgi:hypothetical protein
VACENFATETPFRTILMPDASVLESCKLTCHSPLSETQVTDSAKTLKESKVTVKLKRYLFIGINLSCKNLFLKREYKKERAVFTVSCQVIVFLKLDDQTAVLLWVTSPRRDWYGIFLQTDFSDIFYSIPQRMRNRCLISYPIKADRLLEVLRSLTVIFLLKPQPRPGHRG